MASNEQTMRFTQFWLGSSSSNRWKSVGIFEKLFLVEKKFSIFFEGREEKLISKISFVADYRCHYVCEISEGEIHRG